MKYNIIIFILIILISFILLYSCNKNIDKFFIKDHNDIIFYSYGTDYIKFNLLMKSAKKNNINIYIDGIGKKWNGFHDKLISFNKFIKNIDDNKIVMCLDAYDTIIFDNSENIKNKFLKFKKPIVISAEIYCWPDGGIWEHYPKNNKKFKYVNAGSYMGYAKDLKIMLKSYEKYNFNCPTYLNKKHDVHDDQRCLTTYYLNNTDKCALDYNQSIWSLANGTKNNDYTFVSYNKFFNNITNINSSIFHYNSSQSWYKNTIDNLYKLF